MEPRDILVVDDSLTVRAMVADILQAEGYRVQEAKDGREGLEKVAEICPDLVILDVMMPAMNGYEVCSKLRESSDYVPVLMFTASSDDECLVRCLGVGADDFVRKPFAAIELAARVRNLLRIRALQSQLREQNEELAAVTHQLAAQNENLRSLNEKLDIVNRELETLSVTDSLTQAYNRRYFFEQLASELSRAERYGKPLTCVLLDVDHFKQVNDRHGHLVGDRVLARIAEILRGNIRSADVMARFGGEEFVILLPQTEANRAATLVDRIRQEIERERFPATERGTLRVTVSAGIAPYEPVASAEDPDALLRETDQALYRAKAAGRNRIELAA
jgi:diguanylate cyclase (GGDEF)-like protein